MFAPLARLGDLLLRVGRAAKQVGCTKRCATKEAANAGLGDLLRGREELILAFEARQFDVVRLGRSPIPEGLGLGYVGGLRVGDVAFGVE